MFKTILLIMFLSFNLFSAPKDLRIGVIFDGDSYINEELLALFQKDIEEILNSRRTIILKPENILKGNWNKEEIVKNIEILNSNDDIDLILAFSFISPDVFLKNKNLKKPIIYPFIIDTNVEHVASDFKDNPKAKKYFSYTKLPYDLSEDLKILNEIRAFKKIILITNPLYKDLFTEIANQSKYKSMIEVKAIETGNVKKFLKELKITSPKDTSVYYAINNQLGIDEFIELIKGINQKKMASFSISGKFAVKSGVLATLVSQNEFKMVSRRTALNIEKLIIRNRVAYGLSKFINIEKELNINKDTLKEIGVHLDWNILDDANLYSDKTKVNNKDLYTLDRTIKEAVDKNLDIIAQVRSVEAKEEDIKTAVREFLPKLDLSASGIWIDKDRAESSLGMFKEKSIVGEATVTQLIYAESAFANKSMKESIRDMDKHKLTQIKEDIAKDSAYIYLNLLSINAYINILSENLKLSKKYLRMAKLRQRIGVKGPGDIYRWESQVATDRKTLLDMKTNKKVASMIFNRLLHRDLEAEINLKDVDFNSKGLITSYFNMKKIRTKHDFRLFRDILVKLGLRNSSEIRQIESAINLKKRYKTSLGRSFWAPTVALQGKASYNAWSDTPETNLPPQFESLLPSQNKLNWSVALVVNLPIFDGAKKMSESSKTKKEILQLYAQKSSIMQKLEEQVRAASFKAGVSFRGINLSNQAKIAADKTLDLIEDAYAKGVVDNIALIDIQRTKNNASQAAISAKYQFLADIINLQRTLGKVTFILTTEDSKEFKKEIKEINKK